MGNIVVQSYLFADPDHLPPIINSSYVLSERSIEHHIIAHRSMFSTMPDMIVRYPASTYIHRHGSSIRNSFLRYISFIIFSVRETNRNAHILIGHNVHGLIVAWVIGFFTKRPYIYHCHDFVDSVNIRSFSARILKSLEKIAVRNVSFVIVPDRTRGEIISRELKLKLLPIVVANAPLEAPSGNYNLLKDELSKKGVNYDRVVIRQGNVGAGHVLENVIKSIPMWSSPQWVFVILGPVKDEYRSQLIALAHDCGVSDRVILLPPVSYQDVKDFTVGADLGHGMYEPYDVNGAYNTTASNKVFEYMAAGLPITLTENPENRNFIEALENGLTVDIYSPVAIARAINEILSNPDKAYEMGRRSKAAFANQYNYRAQFHPVIARIHALLESNSD